MGSEKKIFRNTKKNTMFTSLKDHQLYDIKY